MSYRPKKTYSPAAVKAVKDYLRSEPEVLEWALECYESSYGIGMPMDDDDILSYVEGLDSWGALQLGLRSDRGLDLNDHGYWMLNDEGDGLKFLDWSAYKRWMLRALDEHPIAEFALDGEAWMDGGEFEEVLGRARSLNGKATTKKTAGQRGPAKKKAPTKKATTKKAAPARNVAKTASGKVRR